MLGASRGADRGSMDQPRLRHPYPAWRARAVETTPEWLPQFDEEAARVSGQPLAGRQSKTVLLLGSGYLSSNLGSEVGLDLLDALTHFVADEGNDFGAGFLGQITDLDFRILDERTRVIQVGYRRSKEP